MESVCNKTFLKFLLGFVGIIAGSFLVLAFVGYYQEEIQGTPATLSTRP